MAWFINGRQKHLIRIVESSPPIAPIQGAIIRKLKRWLRIKLVFLILLSLGIIATVTSLVVDAAAEAAGSGDVDPAVEETVTSVLDWIARVAGSFSGIATLGLLLANRTLGQLEIDLLGIRVEGRATADE